MTKPTRPPLKDVAALSGLSEPTVSRVLNGKEGVALSTRSRVIDALRQLGYDDVPEPRADRHGVVGLVVGEFQNPVFATFVDHISSEIGRRGLMTTISVSDRDLAPEERCIAELERCGVDGIVFLGGRHTETDGDRSHYRRLAESGRPIAFVNGTATGLDVPHVWCDERAGAARAVTHLVELGHTRIGCVLGSTEYIPTRRFIDGYREVLASTGLTEPEGAIVDVSFTLEGGRAGATRLLERGITAMITGNDLMAQGAILAGRVRGTKMSVVGYDGTEFTAFTDPPLTTLRQPFAEMAQLVTDSIISEIDGTHRFRDHYVFQPELMVRSSTHAATAAAITNGR